MFVRQGRAVQEEMVLKGIEARQMDLIPAISSCNWVSTLSDGLTLVTCETIALLLAGGRDFHERGVRICWTMALLPLKVHWTFVCPYIHI